MNTLLQRPSQHRFLSLCVLLLALTANQALFADPSTTGLDVTIIAGTDEVVYEFRQNGALRMIRVVPNWGKPYYLVPQDPTRSNGDLDQSGALVPSWTLKQFEEKKP